MLMCLIFSFCTDSKKETEIKMVEQFDPLPNEAKMVGNLKGQFTQIPKNHIFQLNPCGVAEQIIMNVLAITFLIHIWNLYANHAIK